MRAQKPLVVWSKDARRGQIVVSVNGVAQLLGITPRMGMAEALSLHRRRPSLDQDDKHLDLELVEYDPQTDIEALVALAIEAQQFSPIVGTEEIDRTAWSGRNVHAPQGLVFDVTGIGDHFGGEQNLCMLIDAWLRSHRLLGSLAIGRTLGCAWAVSNYHRRKELIERFLRASTWMDESVHEAKPRSEHHRPPNEVDPCFATIVPAGEESLALGDLPIESLRIEPETGKLLRRLGLQRVAHVAVLPRESLASRFGEYLNHRLDQAFGSHSEPLVGVHALPDLRFEFLFEHATDRRAIIQEIVSMLIQRLADNLQRRGEGAIRLVCRLDLEGKPAQFFQLGLCRASAEADYLSRLLEGALEHAWKPLAPVQRVVLQATMTGPLKWRQMEFLESEETSSKESLVPLIDQLSFRLGRKNVVSPKLDPDPQPERTVHWKPLTGLRPDGTRQKTKRKLARTSSAIDPQIDDPLRRPSTLLKAPAPIQVLAIFPGGVPCRFHHDDKRFEVTRHWGPERIESGWWRGPSHRRDYYRVESSDGTWMWIYRDLQSGAWFLHGMFD